MATVTESFSGVNYFTSNTFTSSATIFTNDSYEITLNATFPNDWGTPSTTNGSVSLTSGGGSATSQAKYTITGMSAGSGSFSVPVSQAGGSGGPATQTVNFTVSAALNGDLTPNSFATTESQGGVTVTANVNTSGTYYWDLERNPGEPSGANSFGFNAPTSGSLSLTANTNQNFTTGAPNQSGGSTSNIGYQGVDFTIDLFTGASRTGTLLDTSTWTIYETITGLSVGSSTININAGDTTFSQNVTTNWRGSDTVSLRIRNTTLSTTVDSFSTSNGSTTLGRTGITAPPAGTTYNYRAEAFNGNSWLTNGPTFSVTRANYSPPDIDVTETSSREYNPGATSYTMTFSNGTSGDEYQLRDFDSGTQNGSVVGTATADASGNFSITVGSTYLSNSGSSDTSWFSLYARRPTANGGDNSYDHCSGTDLVNTLNLTRRPYTPTYTISDDDAASASVGIIFNVTDGGNSAGTVDRLYVYQYKNGSVHGFSNRTWNGNGNYSGNFEQPRNTGSDTYYYRAFVQKSGDGAPYVPQEELPGTSFFGSVQPSNSNYQAGYISPDTSITTSRIPSGQLTANNTQTVTVFVNNGGVNDTYRIYRTSPSLLLIGDTGPLSTSTGTINLSEATSGHLPPPGQTYEYAISAKRAASLGGTDVYVNTGTTFSITKQGPSGNVSFAGVGFATEGGSGLEFIFDNTVDGTYYYDVDRVSGTVGSGEITNPGPSPITVSSGSARVTVNFTNDSTTEIGFQGEEFTMKYGTTSGASDLDTLNFTLYDDDTGISYTSSTVNINGSATSHQISVVRAAGDSSTSVSAYIAVSGDVTPLSTNLSSGSGNDFILGTGTTVITVNDVPGAGSSEDYYVRIDNGQQFIDGPTYTVNQAAVPTAPTSITFETDQNVADESILQAVTIAGGSGGTIQYSEDNVNWSNYSGPTDFLFVRNTSKTIYARRNDGGTLSSVSQSSKLYGYFTGDPSAVGTPAETSISANDLTGVGIVITGGSANTRYRVVNTSVSPTFGIGNTGDGNGTVTATGNTQDLPGKGQTDNYKIQYKVLPAKGGDNTWRDVVPSSTSTITRTTDIPNSFSFDTRTNQATNTEVVDNVQITGLTQESIVRRTSGTGTFAVSSTSTTPTTGFSTADKTITNGQYIHVKDTTSTSANTQKSTTISVGTQTLTTTNNFSPAPETSTFSYTTAAAGDLTIQIQYDPENTDYNITLSGTGGNGLTQNTAREVTAGQDVVFENTSDPIATDDIVISGLGFFTNNSNVTIAQGGSVTRTWDSGNLGNTVEQLTVATDVPVVNTNIYLKEPAVDPDLTVTPVTPANIDWDQTTSFNVTVNNVTSGETYKITEENFTTSLGSATASGTSVTIPMTLGNSTTGYGQLGLGDTQTYEIHASRPTNLGGTGSFVQTDDTFTVTRSSQVVSTPTDITFSPASTTSNSANVTVTAVGSVPSGATLQVRLGNGSWLTSPQTYNLTRGTTYSFSARVLGFQGASTSGIRVESYQVPYLSPDTSVSVVVTTIISANAGNQTVRVQNGNSLDTYSLTSLDGATIYDSITGNGNLTLTASGPDELPASGSNQSYRIRAQRPILSGGDNSPVNTTGTNNNFTITRNDPTQPIVSIDADPGTRSKSVSLGVDASGGTGSTFQVSEDNINFVASGTAFEFTRGVNKTVYGRSLTDSNPSTSGTASRQLDFIDPDTSVTIALSKSTITAGETANITATITGGTQGDIVDLRTNDTNTPLASGTSVGSATFDASGSAAIIISSGEQPDATGTSAQYRAYVQTPQSLGGDGNYDATSQTASITRGALTQPNAPVIPDDTTTRSQSVDLTVTVDGGSGGVLELSENQTVWFTTDTQAFTFTRDVEKTIYARRRDGVVTSAESSASRKLAYIPPDTDVNLALSATSISPGSTAQVTASVRNVTIGERLRILTTNANTQNGGIGFNVGSASARNSTTVAIALTDALNELPSFSTAQVVASYKLQVRKFEYDGGSGDWVDTGDTFNITRRAFTAPTSIQFPSDPGTLSDSVSLTVNIAGGAEGSLQISEDNTNWTTGTSGSFEFTRNTPKTIYARRIDGTQVSSVTSSSFELSHLQPDTTIGITPSTTSITAGYGGTVTVAITGATPQDVYRLVTTDTNTPQNSGYLVDSFTGTTASSFTIANNELPELSLTAGYKVLVFRSIDNGGDGSTQAEAGTFNITRGGLSAPTSIQFPSDPGTASKSVSLTVTIGGGSGGDLEISEDNSTWFTQASRAFEFTRNVPKTIYARRNDSGTLSSVTQSSFTLSFLSGDGSVTTNVSESSIAYLSTTPVTVGITEGASNTQYRVVNNSTPSTVYGNTITGNGTITLANPGDLPTAGASITYRLQFARTQASGGSGSFATATPATFTISRSAQDITPDAFNFTDTTNASRSSFQFSTVQITGLNDTATVSVTQNNGAGQFVVDNNATAPSSGYGTTGSITNNQYLHARILSSNSLGGTVSSRFTVGTVFDDFKTTTTNQSADLVITINYFPGDNEPGGGASSALNIFSSPSGFTTDAGNTVRFTFSSVDPGVTSISLSALNIFTNNADFVISNGSSVTRTLASGTTPATTDTISVVSRGDDIITDTFDVTITPLEPDTSVSIANVAMAASASTFTATIEEKTPNQNSSVTEYLIKEGGTTLATRTGPGSVSASSFPPFLGVPVTRGVYARIPPGSGGTNQQKFIQSFEVTRGSAPGGTDPLQNTYGIAIYDNTGTLVTTFAEGSSIGKKIFTGTAGTSTSACTEIATGLTGLSNANCFTIITSDASDGNPEGFKALPSTIKADGSTLLLGREQYASESVEVTIIQTKGATISNTTASDYGIEIYNENGDLIIDDLAQCFAVREIINCAGATTFGGDYTLFDITLVEGRYPFSAGPPIPAIQGPGLRRLAPPYLLGGNANYSSSYGKVRVVLPQGVSDVANYNIAMLVDREANPVYYGGSASDYGIQVKDANGNITWDSGWRQAIINNIVSANQFTLGTNQNGTYDVTTGYDGVTPPNAGVGQAAELSLLTSSTGQTITINNLNIMDPTNTFLLGGGLVTGKVKYRQTYVTGELGQVEPADFYGGGTHVPAVTITSNSSVNITMLRTGDGPLPPQTNPNGDSTTWGTRDPNSQHPAGYYVFARIT